MSTHWSERYARSKYLVQKIIRDYSEKPALKAYLEIFMTLAAISLFGVFAIRPTTTTIGKLLQEIKAKEQTLKTMNEKINNLKIAKDLYTRENDKIKLVEEAIPKSPKPEIVALQIGELAKSDSVNINGFSVEGSKILGAPTPDDDQMLSLTLSVSGNYINLINFAKDVENLRRPIKYDSYAISSLSSKDGQTLFMVFSNLTTPYSNQ